MYEENTEPYRKKKESSVSKSSRKSNHKHIWEECFLHSVLPDKHYGWITDQQEKEALLSVFSPGYRCAFCGRLKMNYDFSARYTYVGQFIRALTKEELLDSHPDWAVYEVPGEDWYNL